MDDDEEIELLRLAALKSLNVKKEHQLTQFSYHPQTGNAIQVLENITGITHIPKYQQPEGQRICIPEPFPRQIIATTTQPYSINQNVQLSPRSAAFVSDNYGILMKRKEDTFRRSPSYKSSPGRWSVSPPPSKQKRLSPEPLRMIRKDDHLRTNEQKSYGSSNRVSPLSQRRLSKSPTSKCRKFSRSPPKNRILSKSPMRYNATSPNFARSKSRSPGKISRSPTSLRHATPTKRSTSYRHLQVDNYKSKSNYSHKPNSVNVRKLDSYNSNTYRRRTKPKFASKSSIETSSKSKVDKSIRSYNEYPRRRSPDRTKYTKSYSNNSENNHQKNYDRPPLMTKKHSIESNVDSTDEVQNQSEINEVECNPKDTVSINEHIEKVNIVPANEIQTETTPNTDNDENSSNESNDDDDDGIDLFASEESESENEGRFKCGTSSKSEKPKSVSTVSFTKLGDTLTSTFTNLNDVGSNKHVKNKDSESDRSYNKFSSRRDDRRIDKDSNRTSNRTKVSTSMKSSSERKKSAKPMFKSTFLQVAESVVVEKPIGK